MSNYNHLNGSGFGSRGNFADSRWPDPFVDAASLAMPRSNQDALLWCQHITGSNGVYRSALSRVVSYFLTDLEITAKNGERVGHEEKQQILDFLHDVLNIKSVLKTVAMDYLIYGNSFTSLQLPFRRYLSCPFCHTERPLKRVFNSDEYRFSWNNFQFHANCPNCRRTGVWRHIDRRSGEDSHIKVKRWNPLEIDIIHDDYSDDCAFVWRIPADYRNKVRNGPLHTLERVSWEVIEAVKNDYVLMFDPNVVYHMREDTPAGYYSRGWGMSRVLTNFRQAWYVQVLYRFNEAIALDRVVPFNVITPAVRAGAGGGAGVEQDPVLNLNMGNFSNRVNQMLKKRRRDPNSWHVLPSPIEYQALGGDATQLAPKDLIDQGLDTLLNATDVPVELYKGSLSIQAAPAALRLFEANWSHLVHNLNRFLTDLVDKVCKTMSWDPVVAKLQRVTHADDLNRQMAKLQLMMGGEISKTTGLSSVGLDFAEESRRKLEEERTVAEETQDMQEEMEQAAMMDEIAASASPAAAPPAPPAGGGGQMPQMQGMPGAMPGGGMPAPAAGAPAGAPAPAPAGAPGQFAATQPTQPNMPTTPEEMMAKAQTLAEQLLMQPDSIRRSQLIQLEKEDPVIHALVSSLLDQMRNQASLQGRELILQQHQQQGKQASHRAPRYIDLE